MVLSSCSAAKAIWSLSPSLTHELKTLKTAVGSWPASTLKIGLPASGRLSGGDFEDRHVGNGRLIGFHGLALQAFATGISAHLVV